eukprot:s500_g9.t1
MYVGWPDVDDVLMMMMVAGDDDGDRHNGADDDEYDHDDVAFMMVVVVVMVMMMLMIMIMMMTKVVVVVVARNLDSLGLGNDEAAKFEKGYGRAMFVARSLSDAMSAGEVCSAVTAMEILQVEPGELLQRCLDAGYEKLRSGLYCAKLAGGETGQLFVLNGFYARMREKFTKAGVVVHWHVVGFDSGKLPWTKFRSEVIGATNPVA